MKKVRFESPAKVLKLTNMNDTECHSPRPFIGRRIPATGLQHHNYTRIVPYSADPLKMFECSNSSPYPLVNKTQLPSEERPKWSPSNDLDLSMLDASNDEPRRPMFCKSILKADNNIYENTRQGSPQVLSAIENKINPPNVLSKDSDFFLRRDNLNKFNFDLNPVEVQLNNLILDKENGPLAKKAEIMKKSVVIENKNEPYNGQCIPKRVQTDFNCQHCVKHLTPTLMPHKIQERQICHHDTLQTPKCTVNNVQSNHCHCALPRQPVCSCCENILPSNQLTPGIYACTNLDKHPVAKVNAVDKKTWAIEKYEQSKKSECMEIEKQTSVVKEKREPTVADLFKIIKLQNEQLQLLQEKVDKFMSVQSSPIQNSASDHVAIQTVGNEEHKISVGVMTSFEMVRTSTIINKEVLKTNENAQIQCNRSQISIKEVVSKSQTPNLNFLDGIAHVDRVNHCSDKNRPVQSNTRPQFDGNEEKTLNELSLYNVQVDNATTPLMSPDQSLYLDIRDYSDSEPGSDDQSNVGWTYYNKVMTHVNGMLQDSDMPSSASAMYRNTRQQMQTVQMQIDKTNVSVTKRVKFGDDPIGIQQPHIHAVSTDTSLKMNQLAAKYLKNRPVLVPQQQAPKSSSAPIDMSFATRNYMERHKLLQGVTPAASRSPPPSEMPRFLDITALKQQTKLL